MSFYKQFENFDPVKGTLPVWPFREARAIAARARSLVQVRTAKDIEAIVEDAYALIELFFDIEKSEALRMLVEEGSARARPR